MSQSSKTFRDLSRSSSLPNLDGKHGLITAVGFASGIPFIIGQPPEIAYDFIRELGTGEYACTYLVRRRSSGRQLACKEILKGETEVTLQRARTEVEVHCALSGHPNIVGLIEVWEDRKSFYMILELCNGGELFHAISERGSLTEWEAASVLKVVLQVLQHCHTKGIIHRDIKPENFMLKDLDGRLEKSNIVGIDFGCSCFATAGQSLMEVVGSPMYLAPEAVAVDLESKPWPYVCSEGKDLVRRLLDRDPQKRITVENALNSTWLRNLTAPSCQPLNLLIVDRLRDFASFTTLQRLLLNLISSCLPASNSRKHLQRLFDDLDINGDGLLDVDELFAGLLDMGVELPMKEAKCLTRNGLDLKALERLMDQSNLSVSNGRADVLKDLLTSDGIPICDGCVQLQDLEEHMQLCKLGKPCSSAVVGVSKNTPPIACQTSKHPAPIAGQMPRRPVDSQMEDLELKDDKCIDRSNSPLPRACSPELSKPFFFQSRKDDQKAGGTKSAAPVFPEGGSPPAFDSAWSKMLLECSRGKSPDSCSGLPDCSLDLKRNTGAGLGSSPDGSHISSQDIFMSAGVTYWAGPQDEAGAFDEENEEIEDNDALFGPALSAITRHGEEL